LRVYNAAKCDCGRGFAPYHAGGTYRAPPDPLAGFKGAWRGERGRDGKGKGKEVDSHAQLEHGR